MVLYFNQDESEFMPIINVEKCYEEQSQHKIIAADNPLPKNWLSHFFQSLSEQLEFDPTKIYYVFDSATETNIEVTGQALFIKHLNRHAGEQSVYTHKTTLLQSLGILYNIFTDTKTKPYHRKFIAIQLNEEVRECTPGFHNRVQTLLIQFNTPYRTLPDLIADLRFKLMDKIASIIAANHLEGIHLHNRVSLLATKAGYGVSPINANDVYFMARSKTISDDDIQSALSRGFHNHFQLFALLNGLTDHLKRLVQELGYTAKPTYTFREAETIHACIQRFIPMTMDDLFERDSETLEALDICWKKVKKTLYEKLINEAYFSLHPSETALLECFFSGQIILSDSDTTPLSLLIPQAYELAQCLEFFNEWDIGQKATLVSAYLFGKSTDVQKNILDILYNEAPLLTNQLKNEPNLINMFLFITIAQNDVNVVRECIEKGANINAALPLLFSQKHKSATLYWFYENPTLLQKMTAADFNVVINRPDKYKGKTVAQILAATKKGRQLIGDNKITVLNDLCRVVNEAEIEKANNPNGFFAKLNNKPMELVQSIVYGDLSRVAKNPFELIALFCEKATVKDYSKRKFIQVTAFQAALCARDDEACALLASYMQKEEWIRQYQAIFPEGHELYYSKQTPFDFQEITNAITSSSDADLQKALDFKLPDNSKLLKALETFRGNFTALSCKENVFNPKHLISAYEMHDKLRNSHHRVLFWRQIIGFVQRFLPSNLAMDCAQGFCARVEKKEKSKRSFRCAYGGKLIFPLAFDRIYTLGYNHAIDGWGREIDNDTSQTGSESFSKLLLNKSSHLSELLTQRNIQPNYS